MRIAIFTWGLPGGAFAHCATALAKGFAGVSVTDVEIVFLDKGPGPHIKVPPDVHLHSLGVRRARWAPVALAKYLRDRQPDLLITMPTFISVAAAIGCRLAGGGQTLHVVNQGDTLTSDIRIEHRRSLRMRTLPWLARLSYPGADGVVACTQGVLEIVRELGLAFPAQRMAVIPLPVDLDIFAHGGQREHPWLRDKTVPVIVSAGGLVKRKNFPLLIEAFAEVRKRMDARLIIFGDGPERGRLERTLALTNSRDISLAGHVNDLWSNVRQANVFAMSSVDEAFCLVLAEAMACGVPVVATDAIGGGPRSILDGGRYGVLVPSGDVEALADALTDVLTDGERREHLARAGKQRSQDFRPEVVAQQWLRFVGVQLKGGRPATATTHD